MPVFLKKSLGGEGWYRRNFPASSTNVPKINNEKIVIISFRFFPYLVIMSASNTAVVTSKEPIGLSRESGVSKALGNISWINIIVLRSKDAGICKKTSSVRI